jgi:predicted amidohydrolase YtcJ
MSHASLALLLTLVIAFGTVAATAAADSPATHRYMVERTFPPGALDGLDAATKAQVNSKNAALGVRWVGSYATGDLQKTFCVYEGPDAGAIRAAAADNGLPVDSAVEIPYDLEPGPRVAAASAKPARRFLVERTFPAGALDTLDDAAKRQVNRVNAELGVVWVHSYVDPSRTRTWCIYEAPDEAAVREAARRNGIPADRIVEVPVDLDPD